jgi:hypothetical protein
MKGWKPKLQSVFERVDDWADEIRQRLDKFDEPDDDIFILPFTGFGNHEKIFSKGRVLEKNDETLASETDSRWRNLVRMFRLFETDEIPNARLKMVFGNLEKEIRADREGYFDIELDIAERNE